MAQRRSSLASYGLAKAHVTLSPSKVPQTSPAALEREELASDIPSLARRGKSLLVNYPCRLREDQVKALNHLRDSLGVLPAELIRDFIDLGLRRVKVEGVFRVDGVDGRSSTQMAVDQPASSTSKSRRDDRRDKHLQKVWKSARKR